MSETIDDTSALDARSGGAPVPGAVVLWSLTRPVCVPFASTARSAGPATRSSRSSTAGAAKGRTSSTVINSVWPTRTITAGPRSMAPSQRVPSTQVPLREPTSARSTPPPRWRVSATCRVETSSSAIPKRSSQARPMGSSEAGRGAAAE